MCVDCGDGWNGPHCSPLVHSSRPPAHPVPAPVRCRGDRAAYSHRRRVVQRSRGLGGVCGVRGTHALNGLHGAVTGSDIERRGRIEAVGRLSACRSLGVRCDHDRLLLTPGSFRCDLQPSPWKPRLKRPQMQQHVRRLHLPNEGALQRTRRSSRRPRLQAMQQRRRLLCHWFLGRLLHRRVVPLLLLLLLVFRP
jgi:hypothetical protein